MQHVDAFALEPARKHELMPRDVLHRRAPLLGHRHELHLVLREVEERQVFFQDKQMELMLVRVREQRAHEGEDILCDARLAALDDAGGDGDLHARMVRRLRSSSVVAPMLKT